MDNTNEEKRKKGIFISQRRYSTSYQSKYFAWKISIFHFNLHKHCTCIFSGKTVRVRQAIQGWQEDIRWLVH